MNILITGASSGIGRELAIYYLNCGDRVAAIARREDRLQQLYQDFPAHRERLEIYVGDVSNRQHMREIVTTIEQDLGAIDLAIANAGIVSQQFSDRLNFDDFEPIIATNVMGVVNTLLPAISTMLDRRQGHIVVISSLAGVLPIPRLSIYGASKAFINYFLEGMYYNLKSYNICVTAICPGFIDTDLTRNQQVPQHWCMNLEDAIALIVKAIEQKKRFYAFPWHVYFLWRFLGLLPTGIKDFFIAEISDRFFSP